MKRHFENLDRGSFLVGRDEVISSHRVSLERRAKCSNSHSSVQNREISLASHACVTLSHVLRDGTASDVNPGICRMIDRRVYSASSTSVGSSRRWSSSMGSGRIWMEVRVGGGREIGVWESRRRRG